MNVLMSLVWMLVNQIMHIFNKKKGGGGGGEKRKTRPCHINPVTHVRAKFSHSQQRNLVKNEIVA